MTVGSSVPRGKTGESILGFGCRHASGSLSVASCDEQRTTGDWQQTASAFFRRSHEGPGGGRQGGGPLPPGGIAQGERPRGGDRLQWRRGPGRTRQGRLRPGHHRHPHAGDGRLRALEENAKARGPEADPGDHLHGHVHRSRGREIRPGDRG